MTPECDSNVRRRADLVSDVREIWGERRDPHFKVAPLIRRGITDSAHALTRGSPGHSLSRPDPALGEAPTHFIYRPQRAAARARTGSGVLDEGVEGDVVCDLRRRRLRRTVDPSAARLDRAVRALRHDGRKRDETARHVNAQMHAARSHAARSACHLSRRSRASAHLLALAQAHAPSRQSSLQRPVVR